MLTVTDGSGNIATCSQLISVIDTIKPSISCPPNVNITANLSCSATGVLLGTPTTSDNCTVASITNNHASSTYPLGNTTVIWTVTDGSGNIATCSQLVSVIDTIKPSITCPATISAVTNTGCTATGVILGTPITSDNCTVTSVTNNHPSNTYSIGNTTVIWTVTDGSGNTTSCSQLVIVTDTVKPTISCPPTATVETNAGCTAIGVTLGTPTTSDNCHVSSVTNNAPLVFHLGNTLVTWTVTDDAGNFAVCNQLIIVVDNITPIIICPSTVITKTNSGCSATGVSLGTPFTSDNCSIASITNNAPSTFPLGNTTVIWTVTDGSGNTALCSQLVTVNDTIKPSITCPPAKIITINNGCTATGVSLGTPVTTDNCSVASVTNNAPLAFPIGITTVTWTVTDGSGNISTCNQLITVLDTINPTINCPATKTVSTNIGCTAVGVLLGTPIVSDNCHVATVTNNAPGVFPLGNTFVIWTVTDDAGNTANCSQLVIVVDSVKPIIICPAAIIRGANTGCTATGVDLGTPITADNCSIASITNNAPSAFPLGNTSVIWTITDGAGNVASCNQLVTINDTIKPIITCPPAKIITINNGCTATGVSLGTPVTTDNCSVASVTNNAPLAFPIGITTVTWTVTDGSGNISTCNQLITVLDTINPTINCPATKTVSTNIGCTAVGVLLGTPIVSDNCHVATVTNNAPGVFPLGNTFVIWTVTDDAGNTANCSQLVIVVDSVKPIIICPAAIIRGANTGCTATGVDLGTPITADNCSIASITNNAPSTFPLGNTSVIWTITDGAGNVASCNQLVTIKDTISPSIICPSTKIIGTNSGCNATGINLGFPIVSDNCHLLSVTNNAPAIFPIGNTLVNWIATDSSGNTSTCSQLIIVIDTVKPSISCPPDIIAITNAGCTAIGVSLGTPTASDNCDIENITNDAPGAFPIGTTVVTWTVFDESDNSSSCSQLVTVLDTIKPNIYCPSTIVTSTNFGCSAIGVSLGTPFVLDNCTIFSITNNAPPTFPLGNTIVTWTATDGSGNASSCTQLVTVNDNTNPTIVCPFNIVASTNNGCAATNIPLGAPTSNDNCSVASVTNNAPLSFPLGNTTVTWIVTDGAGNISTCNQTITIVDSIKPSINCPPDVFTTTNVGCIATGITLGTPITGDNCHVASVTNNAPGVFPLGNTIVVWTVTDDAGNSSSCSQLVNVVDNINPIIICPAAIISGTNSGCTASGISLGIPFTSDNCSITSITNNAPSVFPIGNTIVTWTVTDNSGNIATCTQSVTINDNINPTITCPPTIITATNNACNATGISLGTPITSDNCIISSVTNNAPIAFPLGNTNVIWTVTDGSGNITTCSQLVTVIDTIKPTISCPPTLTKTANNGCVATDVILGTPIVWDNCNVASVTNNAPNAYPIGNTIVTWMVVDNAGNATSCEQLVVVVDNTNPIIICPNTLLTATNSECTAIGVNLGTPFTSDNCSIASISNNAPSIFPLGNTIVTWTVTDSSGNFSTCNQLVTVYDNISPSISCPENIETYTDSSCYATHISLGFPFVSDNCTIASVSNNSPQAFIIGNTIVVWTVIDNSGNLSTCNQTVTVVDSIPPIIICHADIIDSTSPGGCSKASISLGSPITSDNCHVASLTNDAPMHYFVGTTVVTWTATDESGNSSNCSQLVYINSTPLAMDDSATTSENTPVQIMELANDLDCGNNLVPESVILVAGSGPLHGSAIVNPITGIITYIPNNSFFGQDQFDYQVCDSSNLCSIATVYITTTIINKQSLGIAKALTKVEVQDDASYNVSFLITAENLGNNIIDNIQITDNLNETFPLPLTFKIISAPYSNSSLSTNASYEGSSDIKLLDSVASHLNIGETATIEFSLNIVTSGIENTYYNSAFGSGYLSAENRITDISQNGFVTDPNGNGFAGDENENIATPVPLFFAIKIPNGFSPDGDGINDLFVIRGIENYPECKFTVYNRWGNVVYSKNGYKNDWDGKSSSSELKIGESIVPRGTYYYVFDYNKENRKPKCGYLIIQY